MLYSFLHLIKYKVIRLLGVIHTRIRVSGNRVSHGSYKSYGVPLIINRDGAIEWGNNLSLNNGLLNNQIGFNCPCIFMALKGRIVTGVNVGISQSTMVSVKGAQIKIGDNTLIGGGCKLYTTDFHNIEYLIRRDWETDYQNLKSESIIIGHDVFIGANTIILKGVVIGDRSIIGAGSVVTKNIPSDEIWAGNPVRFIRKSCR